MIILILMLLFAPTAYALDVQNDVVLEKFDENNLAQLNSELSRVNRFLIDLQKRLKELEP